MDQLSFLNEAVGDEVRSNGWSLSLAPQPWAEELNRRILDSALPLHPRSERFPSWLLLLPTGATVQGLSTMASGISPGVSIPPFAAIALLAPLLAPGGCVLCESPVEGRGDSSLSSDPSVVFDALGRVFRIAASSDPSNIKSILARSSDITGFTILASHLLLEETVQAIQMGDNDALIAAGGFIAHWCFDGDGFGIRLLAPQGI